MDGEGDFSGALRPAARGGPRVHRCGARRCACSLLPLHAGDSTRAFALTTGYILTVFRMLCENMFTQDLLYRMYIGKNNMPQVRAHAHARARAQCSTH
jgi:hypothetical protein